MRSDQVGIYVESVTPGSGADVGGFKMGMVLLEADGTPLAETDVLRTVVLNARLANKSSIIMSVRQKDGRETNMVLPL
jgi:serine protease Do